MSKELKKIETSFKKIHSSLANCTPKNAKAQARKLRYYWYDNSKAFEALYDAVAEAKGENFEGKSIDDYVKEDKSTAGLVKAIKNHQKKQEGVWLAFLAMEKSGTDKVKELQKHSKSLKKLFMEGKLKGSKPDPEITKLIDLIDDDLNAIKTVSKEVELVPVDQKDISKEWKERITKILAAKPVQSKYGKAQEKMFDKKTLRSNLKEIRVSKKELIKNSTYVSLVAKTYIKDKEIDDQLSEMESSFEECTLALEDIQDIADEYSAFEKNFGDKIKEADAKSKKQMVDAINVYKKAKKDAESQYAKAEDLVNKLQSTKMYKDFGK